MNYRIAYPFFPAATFLLLDQAGYGPRVTIAGTFLVTAIVFWLTRRYKLLSAVTVFGFAVGAASTVVGIVIENEHAFLASGPISDFLTVVIVGGSVVLGRPLVGGFTHEIFPAIASRVPANAPVFVALSFLWIGLDLVRGSLRFYLLGQLSPSEYVIWSRVAHWPLTGLALLITVICVARVARRNEEPVPVPIERGSAVS